MAQYPSSAAGDQHLYIAVNNLETTLVGALLATGGNNGADIEVASTTGFPAVGFITIENEAISYTSLLSGPPRFSGITRGADGTTAATHANGKRVRHTQIAAHHNALKEEIKAIETDLVGDKRVKLAGDTMTGSLLLPTGTTTVPSLGFSSDSDTGIFSGGSGILKFTCNTAESARLSSSWFVSVPTFYVGTAGTAALPAISFLNDADTGIYNTTNSINFATAGVARIQMSNINIVPWTDNAYDCGDAVLAWRYVYARSGVRLLGSSYTDYITLDAPDSVPAPYTVKLPSAGPTGNDQVMKVSDYSTGQLSWGTAGSGTGINYITNNGAEGNVTGWVTYADAAGTDPVDGTGGSPTVTLTATGSSPLRGVSSFLLTKDAANRQGEGCSVNFDIDVADEAKPLYISFDYLPSANFADDDLAVWIYDRSNGVVIQPSAYLVKKVNNSSKWIGVFQTAYNSTAYRLIVHVRSTNATAYTLKFDNVSVGPQTVQYGAPVTDWKAYTPTISAGFGTTSNVKFYSRRVGDSLDVQGTFTAGTLASSVASVTLPAGLSIDYSKISTDSGMSLVGKLVAGHVAEAITNDLSGVMVDGSTASTVFFSRYTASITSFAKDNADTVCATNGTVTLWFRVPITGWSSSVQMSNDADTRVVTARGGLTATSITANNPLEVNAWAYDTHGAGSTGSTTNTKYTVPTAGYYSTTVTTKCTALSANTDLLTNVNGVNASWLGTVTTTGVMFSFTQVEYYKAGDIVRIYTANGNITPDQGSWLISRLSGPAVIAATETVAAKYFLAGSVTSDTSNPIDFATKDIDTHGAVTTGASWKFTAPIAGIYRVTGTVNTTSAVVATMSVYKNGVLNSYLTDVDSVYISSGSTLIRLLAGDYIDLRFSSSKSTAASTKEFVCIERIGN